MLAYVIISFITILVSFIVGFVTFLIRSLVYSYIPHRAQVASPTKITNPNKLANSTTLTEAIKPDDPTTIPEPTKLTDLPEELLEHIFKALLPPCLQDNKGSTSFSGLEDYVAISLTSKQFRRIVLPLVNLEYSDRSKVSERWGNDTLRVHHRATFRAWMVSQQVRDWIDHRYWWRPRKYLQVRQLCSRERWLAVVHKDKPKTLLDELYPWLYRTLMTGIAVFGWSYLVGGWDIFAR
jgi:hypothetical protein